ncbi:hypothetical protein N0V90_004594 [Kalmusia sp. IMI 367209]|nr:hypothetical protein N0V90_004594 [Kalmusia sp. IMI 367209]
MSSYDGRAPRAQRYHEEIRDAQVKLSLRSIPELKRASSREELGSISLLSALENDARASFVIDITAHTPPDSPLDMVYFNAALAAAPGLLAKLRGSDAVQGMFTDALQSHAALKQWLWSRADVVDLAGRGAAYLFAGHLWWATTVEHYKIVSGVLAALLPNDGHDGLIARSVIDPREHNEPENLPQLVPERLPVTMLDVPAETIALTPSQPASRFGPFDYTLDSPCSDMSDHILYFRSIDWAKTPLGPMSSWSPQLRCTVNMILNDHYHAVLFWGDDATMIYNEAYIELISVMHPCMGQSARIAAKDFWPHFEPLFQHIQSTGKALSNHDMPLFIDRHGFLEEAFFSFQFIPILDSDGHVAGYYQPLVETTRNKLLERRISSLVEIGSETAKARDLNTYWDLVINTIATNDRDIPFALLYAAENFSSSALSSTSTPGSRKESDEFLLKGSIGVRGDHPVAPSMIDLKDDTNIFHPHLAQAMKAMMPVVVHFSDLRLPDGFLAGIDWRGYGDPCRCVVFCPIRPTTTEQVQGFLILGVNPRRPFDEDYKQFVHVLLRLLATSLASVVLFDEEMRQKENAIGQAARIQEELTAELQLKEKKFQRYADQSDVAIFVVDPVGTYTYRNQGWYDIFGAALNSQDIMGAWTQIVWPEDVSVCEGLFASLVVDKSPICFELKTNICWKPPPDAFEPDNQPQDYYKWILCSAYPELDAKNEILEIVGNVTDISKQKWAEDVQKRRTDSALESKRHLEHFIDTTSHEMRNPLSAIMQCADGILTSYPGTDGEYLVPSPTSYISLLDQTMDAAQTIAQCAQHMKRIVDDILTVSKLDSGLLVITPVDTQPEVVTRHAVKMFEAEAKAAEVDLVFEVDESYRAFGVNWMSLDPTRLLQVLINLITNALKFTRLESEPRHIKVKLMANEREPNSQADDIRFEPKLVEDDAHLKDDWQQGSTLYLQFSVSDTGRGLEESERSTLFARFSQASPRTHIHYGGSGLGLFISRRLTEMQGGAIGLASEFKKGSTFSFYIKARRAESTRVRRPSLPNVFPEDMRHRATTRREISKLHKPESPYSEKSSPEERTTNRSLHQQQIHSSSDIEVSATRKSLTRPATLHRRQSAMHPDIPSAAFEPPEPDLYGMKKANNIPEELHVLVVEDNLVNQKVLAKQLRNLGCVVSVANHGGEALDFLKTTSRWRDADAHLKNSDETQNNVVDLPEELHLVLMDWEMPVMNGLTAVAKIREFERDGGLMGHIPVIGVTANARDQQIQAAMNVGMDDVVSKPFRVSELMNRMIGVVEGVGSGGASWKGRMLERAREGEG